MGRRFKLISDLKNVIAKRPRLKIFLEWFYLLILVAISAFSYALAFRLFIHPSIATMNSVSGRQVLFVGGGVSGLSQNFVKFSIFIESIHLIYDKIKKLMKFEEKDLSFV